MQIVVAHDADLPAIVELLAAAALPSLDGAARADDFRVARAGAALLGAVGVERYDAYGLLRSLVVAPHARGQGLGEALVAAIEAHARATHLRELVLLTTTADKFFARRGYAAFARDAMPQPLRASAEFATLCPASAVCMRKALVTPVRAS
jgi:amino-acid N-acetyltransferase